MTPGALRAALSRHPAEAAPLLLGRVLSIPGEGVVARITEVEAYGGPPDSPWPDPGAHTWPGRTERNRAMFGPAGHLYLYRSYGIHICMNVTCGPEGTGAGVLLRSAAVTDGLDVVGERRGTGGGAVGKRKIPPHRLASGPGNLGRALGAGPADYGIDLLDPGSRIVLSADGATEVGEVRRGPRVGLRLASARPWRFWVDDPSVSAYRRHAQADGQG